MGDYTRSHLDDSAHPGPANGPDEADPGGYGGRQMSTSPLSLMVSGGLEEVAYGYDEATGLRTVLAVHSTVLAPALGGTRFWPYPDTGAALVDVCLPALGRAFQHPAARLHPRGGQALPTRPP